uniref:Telomeric repeat-binding factor 2-interacting protein 1 n=1 Tax=Leptobrachium leishanense TaxID=445787 RepID=A0A8C5PCB4_9ANUR
MSLPGKPGRSSALFVRGDGSPMRFYARPGPVKRQLSSLVTQGGGVMCRVQEPGVLLLAQPGEVQGPEYISAEYVKECARLDQQLDVEDFRFGGRGKRPGNDEVQEQDPQQVGGVQGGEEPLKGGEGCGGVEQQDRDIQGAEEHQDGGQKMTKIRTEKSSDESDADDHGRTQAPDFTPILPLGRRPFTMEEDMAILDYVRRHVPRRGNVSGARLWQEMEGKRVLDRTWQSMKSRYKFYLADSRDSHRPAPSRSPQNKTSRNSESASLKGSTPPERSSNCPERRTSRGTSAGKFSLMSPRKTAHSRKRRKDDGPGNLGLDLHIFEIANLEFQSDDSPVEVTPVKRSPGLKEFVTEEDSISQASMTQVDEVSSSPDVSEGEGLQNALLDMMSEFSLTLCDVTQALLKNNGEVGSTRHFLRTGSRPDGYPIWVRKDDLDLEEEDPTSHERLVQKYGAENVAKRMAFLAS